MFGAIDWMLNKLADIFGYGFTAIIKFVLSIFKTNTSIIDNDNYRGAVQFFFYDTLKIFLMLTIIIYIVSIIRGFFTPEKTRKLLGEGKKRGFLGNVFAALLGIVTPFCSCSAVPVFIGFLEAGIPLGVTLSFLISSPMINEIAIVMLWGLFGWQIALLYIITGLTVAIIAGIIIGKLKMEKYVEEYVYEAKAGNNEVENILWEQRLTDAWQYVCDIIKYISPYVVIGIAIGAVMHGWAPEGWLAKYAGRDNPFSVFLAVLVGIPLYSNAAGTIPIVKELTRLGMPIGTALSFMMAVTALSLPEMIILRRVLKPRLLAVFVGIMAVTIIIIGYMFNIIIPY